MPGRVLGFCHHIGTFLLLASFALMLVVSITAPRINSLGLLHVNLSNSSQVSYGSFGYCVLNAAGGHDYCSGSHIGYKIAYIQNQVDKTHFASSTQATLDGLTNVMVLHPIACGICFIAFAFAVGSGVLGSLLASATALLAWVIVFVAMIIDFIVMGSVKDHINSKKDGQGNHARFGTAMWLVLATFLILLVAAVDLFLSCCARRRERKADKEAAAASTAHGRRRRFRNPFRRGRV